MAKKKFYITTAIDYVNSFPHVGHALEKIQADVIARYQRSLGKDVFFLSGTDENSLKNVRAAEQEKISIKELVDRNTKKFYELKKTLDLSFDDFIRTTEDRHIKGAQKLWLSCKNDIYKKTYVGLYCVGCEEFYKESELEDGLCPEHKTKPELIQEENYFFQLSKYQNQLKTIIENNKLKIVPESRKNEMLSFINSGLEDICISRSSERARGWGIDVPGDNSQKIWVWFDALSNYINALGYAENNERFQQWWRKNNNILHIVGKGISRFHSIYWPTFLISAGILPKKLKIFVHGYITSGGQKMSKSLGNVIDPFDLVKKYGTDPVRYFLLREIPPTDDGDFTYEKFEKRYNADLAAGLGNLIARVLTVAASAARLNSKFQIPNFKQIQNLKFQTEINKTWENYYKALKEFKFNEALISIWDLISFCDKYIEEKQPWRLLSNPKSSAPNAKLKEILSNLLFTLTNIANLLQPFLPQTSERILEQLKTKESKVLFPRI